MFRGMTTWSFIIITFKHHKATIIGSQVSTNPPYHLHFLSWLQKVIKIHYFGGGILQSHHVQYCSTLKEGSGLSWIGIKIR